MLYKRRNVLSKHFTSAEIDHFRTLEAARGKTKETMVGIKVAYDTSKQFTSTLVHKRSLGGYFDPFLTALFSQKPLFSATIGHFRILEVGKGKTEATMVGIKVT